MNQKKNKSCHSGVRGISKLPLRVIPYKNQCNSSTKFQGTVCDNLQEKIPVVLSGWVFCTELDQNFQQYLSPFQSVGCLIVVFSRFFRMGGNMSFIWWGVAIFWRQNKQKSRNVFFCTWTVGSLSSWCWRIAPVPWKLSPAVKPVQQPVSNLSGDDPGQQGEITKSHFQTLSKLPELLSVRWQTLAFSLKAISLHFISRRMQLLSGGINN